jgi:ribose 5-phosphate isomerase A
MRNLKMEAAQASLQFIKADQTIGLGAGTTISYLIDLIAQNNNLSQSVLFMTSSFKTRTYLKEKGLAVQAAALTEHLDIYFDGCDQFDTQLNALKSGGGIHTTEKILASMATEFILIGDEAKYVQELNSTYPLVVEILPDALLVVLRHIKSTYSDIKADLRMSTQKDGAVITENGNLLVDLYFSTVPDWKTINIEIKMIPGIVEHSLFYGMATKAVIAGESGIKIL